MKPSTAARPLPRSCSQTALRCVVNMLGLLAAVASTCSIAVPTCTSASGATLAFGTIVALASTGDITANTGSSFWVNCTSDVTAAPTLHSNTERTLTSGGNSLPFALSAVAPGSVDLPSSSPGTVLTITRNGANQTVTLYGKVRAADFKALPSGTYSRSITLTIEY